MFTFFLILIFLVILLKVWLFFAELGREGTIIGSILCGAVLLGVTHAYLCTNVSWYGKPVVAPEISLELNTGFFGGNADVEPLLGEEIVEGEDGNYYVTLTDHRTNPDRYDDTPDIKIKVTPEAATYKKADATISITKLALENKPDGTSWSSVNNPDLKDQTTFLDDDFTYTIDGGDLRLNESSDVELTKYLIKAKNKRGEISKTLIITHLPLYAACERYDQAHPGRAARDDIALCRECAEYNDERAAEQRRAEENYNRYHQNNSSNSSGSSSSSQPSPTTSACLHYEAGRCWDDLEMEAYSQGQYDKHYGYYGGSYYESDDCDQICQDILEDAYEGGYYDY